MNKAPRRLAGETFKIWLKPTETSEDAHELKVSIMRDTHGQGQIVEITFVGRGKIGHGMDFMLTELGIKLSRIFQGRDPETGA